MPVPPPPDSHTTQQACCAPSMPAGCSSETSRAADKTSNAAVPEAPTKRAANAGDTSDLIFIEGATYRMGSEDDDIWAQDGEAPIRKATVASFYIAPTTVTNAEFAAFVDDTGYVTESERFGWSYVFQTLLPRSTRKKLRDSRTVQGLQWWYAIEGASWKKPEGPGSTIKKRMNHPVVQVSWNDALAYCAWRGVRLPTEAEWEYAARGGLDQNRFPWGNELTPGGKFRCNTWQGRFPQEDTAADGYAGTAPAKSFRANGFGLYNTSGNVWEWCADWFSPTWHLTNSLVDPKGPDSGEHRMMKGGSFLCHDSYCNRYRLAARTGNTPDSATANCGFRIAADAVSG